MTNNPNTQRDISTKDEHPARNAAEIQNPESIVHAIDAIGDAVAHDQPVTQKMIGRIQSALQDITVRLGGENMTIAEARQIPNMKQNAKIWREILNGDSKNARYMTYITAPVARAFLVGHTSINLRDLTRLSAEIAGILAQFTGEAIALNSLTSLEPDVADALSAYKGHFLHLDGLTSLSRETAQGLAKFEGNILRLNGLTSLSDDAADALQQSRAKVSVYLGGLHSLSPHAARALAGFRGRSLVLHNLDSVTDEVAAILAPVRVKISGSHVVNIQLQDAASRLGLT